MDTAPPPERIRNDVLVFGACRTPGSILCRPSLIPSMIYTTSEEVNSFRPLTCTPDCTEIFDVYEIGIFQ